MIHQRKILKAIAYAILLCFTSLTGAQPLYAIPANTQLPTNPQIKVGDGIVEINTPEGSSNMTIDQGNLQTSVIEWGNFSIGADAAVEFKSTVDGFNSLNYVTGANAPISEIYGQLTALGGNIFIANPAGVQIGNSAQINVGSLYVTNKDVGEAVKHLGKTSEESDIISAIREHGVAETNAELMSLGAIVNAKNVTFDGGRIVLDTERIYAEQDGEMQKVENLSEILNIRTTDTNNVVLGYDAYQEETGYSNAETKNFSVTNKDGDTETVDGYMWVHNLAELQAMDKNRSGNYALRNSIDANATLNNTFNPIGGTQVFSGNFDGLGYSIFGLNVKIDGDATAGLFSTIRNANIRNFTINGGSISGGKYVGAVAGTAMNSTIENITNTAAVTGKTDVGGIAGYTYDTTMSGLINIGTITGTEDSVNVGGVVGYMSDGSLKGETYNLGSVTGGWNIGGIAGQMTNGAKIGNDGDDAFQIYNQLNVTGDYNVGGIAGTLSGGTITNAANHGNILAKGYTTETYEYNTVERTGSRETITAHRDNVNVANAGGIVGISNSSSKIRDVMNSGNVTSDKADGDDFYKAGNVGGIVGRAQDTNITNAENKENTVAGAHNVGGVAGFLGGMSTIDTGLNNGGDITGTGARTDSDYIDNYFNNGNPTSQPYDDGFVRERVRPYGQWGENEIFIVGNIGGIAGYIYGDGAQITNSGNRGTVHSEFIEPNTPADMVPQSAKAANVGGVAGKISQLTQDLIDTIKGSPDSATVYNSYNTGDVQGYTGVGGVVGSMYNGSIAGSYNLGTLRSTRQALTGSLEPLNMGGVVGDTTEDAGANAVIYDVYNAGTIGDADYEYYGRHVGGVVGRLSGTLEKSYNTGDVYNGYSTVGGVAGWWYSGNITNVFNTGNVTVRVDWTEDNAKTAGSQVGGIIGASSGNGGEKSLTNAYNLGTIRSFALSNGGDWFGANATRNSIGGIIGSVQSDNLSITNVYTTNNLFAGTSTNPDSQYESRQWADWSNPDFSYPVWENGEWKTYFAGGGFGAIAGTGASNANITNAYYVKMYGDGSGFGTPNTDGVTGTLTPSADDPLTDEKFAGFDFFNQNGAGLDTTDPNFEDSWRIYNGTMPILNAFLPDAEKYFGDLSKEELSGLGIADGGIQYGTAANPLLTIINANEKGNVTLDWEELGSSGNASLAVYSGGLTLDKFDTGTGYYRGTLYADGALKVNGTEGEPFNLGSSANLYGTNVEIDANGDATIYGNVTSTNGGISIKGDDVEIIGKLAASKAGDEAVSVKNIAKRMPSMTGSVDELKDPKAALPTVSDAYAYKANGGANANQTGNISVNASGAAEVLYGNLGTGSVTTAGKFTVTGGEKQEDSTLNGGSVYVDSDLTGTTGGINLSAGGEVLLDITNIAKANSNEQGYNGRDELHKFLEDHGGDKITLDSANDDVIIAIDMWNGSEFDLKQYDKKGTENTFDKAILGLGDIASKTHIWISDADQLKGIQEYAANPSNQGTEILSYNFALKDNIDATALSGYKEIGGDDGFSGTFDGRGFRIIGLNASATDENSASSGIFSKLSGTVKDLRVYASKFFGGANENAGVIAASNEGTITGVTTFGNRVEAKNAGGIAGTNAGTITSSAASDSVITNGGTAGGIAGTNTGTIGAMEGTFVTAESAVTSDGNATAIGGVVGKNENSGKVYLANSLGVTNGEGVDKVGGIAGDNSGTMYSLYNESVVTGKDNVGGVAGTNSGEIENAVNTTGITATGDYAGGLAGVNSGTIDSGRNTGTINGTNNVGGMVGKNEEKADGTGGILKNLSNAVTAAIFGSTNVGGIAGTNSGTITSDNNLVNEGTVYGNQYVGGIAGVNEQDGVIENVTSETLVLKTADGTKAQYFGGIAGQNAGTITDATNESNVRAEGATYVGGIAGQNTDTGRLTGSLVNNGDVTGRSNVGGLAGENNNSSPLKGSADNPLRVTNNGTITATDGGAGGIFHTNTGDIEYAVLTNNGTIIAKGGNEKNTGGLFGSNSGNIAYSTLANSGEVKGGANTGGLIGENSGNASFSSLVNTGKVSGGDNTGGLIGYNAGTLTGGRGTGENGMTLYKYQIYNNGAVSGADNVGGLIGHNAEGGVLYAGYNTGTVNGNDSVGGIAGRNDGSVSSVFNTIMTAFKNGAAVYGEVTGASNAGGLVGFNAGTLTDGYNTTGVSGGGNAAGTNTGVISRVYATNTAGRLIDINKGTASNVYTFATSDGSARFVSEAERMFSRFYGGFGFGSAWKNYDGWSRPMLKVFLTQAGYSADTELVQTGYPMSLPIIKGYVVAGDNLIAYDNANALLVALANTELGEDYLAFYSTQIAASGEGALFNPNNLGYDIDVRYSIVPLFEHNTGYLHWLHRGGDRERNFRERKAEIYFHEGGMVHEEAL